MVKLGLQIKANLTNVTCLYPFQPQKFSWALKVKCTGCSEENPNWHLVSQDETVELRNGEANFVYKCKFCSKESYLSILPSNYFNRGVNNKKYLDTVYLDTDDGTYKTIISFECRGLEICDFEPRDGWAVKSGKHCFDKVDLSENEWYEYNEVDNVSVEITNFQHKFITLK